MANTLNITTVYRRSTFRNEDVLISETLTSIPTLRIVMVIMCAIMGVGTLIDLVFQYNKHRFTLKTTLFDRIWVPILLLTNIILHTFHYAHNIYDPAAYFEPKRLYLKMFFTEMEKTFLFNFPLTLVFFMAVRQLFLSCSKGQSKSMKMLVIVSIYCFMSMVSGGHYTFEPPKEFSILCNVTITGETLCAFVLLITALIIYFRNSQTISHPYRVLSTDPYQLKTRKINAKITTDEDSP